MALQPPPTPWTERFSAAIWHPWFKKIWSAITKLQNEVSNLGAYRIVTTTYQTAGSGTHTFDIKCKHYTVAVMGGGGSGAVNAVAANFGGGGGTGARFVAQFIVPTTASVSYTVGAGGAAVTSAGADTPGLPGTSSFFDIWAGPPGDGGKSGGTPNGGGGGHVLHFNFAGNGDTGTSAGSSDVGWFWNGSVGPGGGHGAGAGVSFAGFVAGSPGRTTTKASGNAGGDGWNGPGGNRQNVANVAGNPGTGWSSGGSGARRTVGNVSSGKGADGAIVVVEYCIY